MKLPVSSLLLLAGVSVSAQEAVVPSETAARESLRLSSEKSSLRLGGLDLFPHAGGGVRYDDNILISHTNQLDDVIWSIAPGLTVVAGDVAAYLPGSVTLAQLRNLIYYSLVDDVNKPGRFFALDYTPTFNLYTDNSKYNYTGQSVQLSGGYSLTRLALGLDFDFSQDFVKDQGIGDLVQLYRYNAYLRSRYDFSDRTSMEVNGLYNRYDYAQQLYQGYDEIKNEDWLNRQFADRLNLGVGLGFGFVFPTDSPDQTYEQLLTRAIYRLTGKLSLTTALGVEYRQYDGAQPDNVNPVFGLTAIYQVREGTTLNLEGHRRDDPSPYGGYNTVVLGGSASVRQLLFGRLYANASLGYDNDTYQETVQGLTTSRVDNYLSARLQFEYEFNRHLTGSLYYTYFRDDSNVDVFNYNNNVVGAQITWRL